MKNCRTFGAILLAALLITMTACPNDPPEQSTAPTVINLAAIAGVTAPAAGETPVMAITETAQYTGTVTWNGGNPAAFAVSTGYTAVIALTAKTGYTLQGVAANFFTVTGATTVSNSANSGVIIAEFPATGATAPAVINIAAIAGVTAPASAGIPVTAITETAEPSQGTAVQILLPLSPHTLRPLILRPKPATPWKA